MRIPPSASWWRCLLAAAPLLLTPAALASQTEEERAFLPLAALTFDRHVDSGPDTFRVFEQAKGRVTRTRELRFSGEHSLEIRDSRGDGDFPELLGFFPRRDSGQVFVHFALLVTDPRDELHIALVGPEGFRLEQDGFAVWLSVRDGVLRHFTDSIPKRLLSLEAFTWYQIDLLYDVDSGSYTLSIQEEGVAKPAVQLVEQANATRRAGSAVDKFSFVGDPFTDLSKVVYYVDDIVVGADEAIELPPFVAPGRRRLFVEMFLEELEEGAAEAPQEEPGAADRWLDAVLAGDYVFASRFAREQAASGGGASWLERAGDAALLARDPLLALELYRSAAAAGVTSIALMLKRADAHFLLGEVEKERRLREGIYGAIESRGE